MSVPVAGADPDVSADASTPFGVEVPRVLGTRRGAVPGPTLVVVGGLHGNEPAGVLGFQRVLAALERDDVPVVGELVGLAGNRAALERGCRYVRRDLNRAWTPDRLEQIRVEHPDGTEAEDLEQAQLLEALQEIRTRARGPVHVLDLHSTSGPGGVFSTMSDRLPNRAFGRALPLPVVLGLEEQIDGTLMDYLDREGLTSMSVEVGQHAEPQAVERAEDVLWILLAWVGLLPADVPEVGRAQDRLEREFAEHPQVSEIRYRHPVSARDQFEMLEGFRNFQRVHKDELLAHDRAGEIRAPMDGIMLMPLYQEQGDDGFFLMREFSTFWLALSARMRRWGLGAWVHLLPGITRARSNPDVLYVNRHVARWYALEVLHLLGYRRIREGGKRLLVIRRDRGSGTAASPPE